MNWYSEIVKDWSKIACIEHYSNEVLDARQEVRIHGNVEKNSTPHPNPCRTTIFTTTRN